MSLLVKICPENFHDYQNKIIEIEDLSFRSPWSLGSFAAELQKPVSQFWALTDADELLGYICFWMFDNEVQLVNIAVHPQNRGIGYGQILLTKMMKMSVSRGIHHVWLEVRPSNSVARHLYEKMGFKVIGHRLKYYSDNNEDALIMDLDLSSNKRCQVG